LTAASTSVTLLAVRQHRPHGSAYTQKVPPMKLVLLRAVAIITLLAPLLLVSSQSASADYWGALKWPGAGTYPDDCLVVGANIGTGSTPYKHNAVSSSSCTTPQTVRIELDEFNSSGTLLHICALDATSYAQCQLQDTSGSGDYWVWTSEMDSTGDNFFCDNQGLSFSTCFTSLD